MGDKIAFSERTIRILKNYNTIFPSIVLVPGNLIYTSRDRSLFAWTSIAETIPEEVPLYFLSEFIAMIDKFGEEAKVEFKGDRCVVSAGKGMRVTYKYTESINLDRIFPRLPFPSDGLPTGAQFIAPFSSEKLQMVKKISPALGLDKIQIEVNEGKAIFRATSSEKGNFFEIGMTTKAELEGFEATIDVDRFIMLDDNYKLHLLPRKGIIFEGSSEGVNYLSLFDADRSRFQGSN